MPEQVSHNPRIRIINDRRYNMSEQNRLGPMLRFCCVITSADPVIMGQCNQVDRRRIVRHALALICTFIMAAVLWSAVLSEMLPFWGAIVGGLFAGLIIYLLDLSISTSDWELKGVLRESIFASFSSFNRAMVRLGKLLLRLGLAITLAFVTGTYVTLYWFSETLEEKIHQERIAINQPVEEEFRTQREQLRNELIAPIKRDLDAAMTERSNLQGLLLTSQNALAEAENTATQARLDMHREETGLERTAGRGPRYHDAKIRFEEANRQAARAEQDIKRTSSRLGEIEKRIDSLNTRIDDAAKVFDARVAILAQERDVKLMSERTDFLMKFTALKDLRADINYGTSVSYIAILTKATIIIFELIFILTLMNDHASIYTLRMIGRTRLEAKQVDTEFSQALSKIDQSQNESNKSQLIDYKDDNDLSVYDSEFQPHGSDPSFAEQKADNPIFDPLTQQYGDEQENSGRVSPDNDSPNDEHSLVPDAEEHPVIGGDLGEIVSVAQALADEERFWVNPDNPSEIWDRAYRSSVLGEDS